MLALAVVAAAAAAAAADPAFKLRCSAVLLTLCQFAQTGVLLKVALVSCIQALSYGGFLLMQNCCQGSLHKAVLSADGQACHVRKAWLAEAA